jgi:hypothetical protein
MERWGRKGPGSAALLLFGLMSALNAAPTLALEYGEVPAVTLPVPISAGMLPEPDENAPRTLTLRIDSGYCTSEPKPRIDHVRVVERPKTNARPYKSSVITVYLLRPAHTGFLSSAEPRPRITTKPCAGLGLTFVKRIKLKRPAADLRYFDGSVSPPQRMQLLPTGSL